jgi:hypothetical protein
MRVWWKKRITGGSLLYLADGCAQAERDMRYLSQLFIGKVSPL